MGSRKLTPFEVGGRERGDKAFFGLTFETLPIHTARITCLVLYIKNPCLGPAPNPALSGCRGDRARR